jgi:hypothetical protein
MIKEWPRDVRGAIEWHHEAQVRALDARRQHELAQLETHAQETAKLGGVGFGVTRIVEARVAAALFESQRKVDLLELEAAKRRRWVKYLVSGGDR